MMEERSPKVRASGLGGIVISCADPRVPCEQILGLDKELSKKSPNGYYETGLF